MANDNITNPKDYNFGRVGSTKNVYINGNKFIPAISSDNNPDFPHKEYYMGTGAGTVTGWQHSWISSNGFYDGNFPIAFSNTYSGMPKERTGLNIFKTTSTNPNISRIDDTIDGYCLNGWYFNDWSSSPNGPNDQSYIDAKTSAWGQKNHIENYYRWPAWEDVYNPTLVKHAFCRLRFPIKDMLSGDVYTAYNSGNITISKLSGYIRFRNDDIYCESNWHNFLIYSRATLDENGWDWDYSEILYYFAQSYTASTDYPTDASAFTAHIKPNQEYLFIDIVVMYDGSINNNSANPLTRAGCELEFVVNSIEYSEKFNGNIYTAPNQDTAHLIYTNTTPYSGNGWKYLDSSTFNDFKIISENTNNKIDGDKIAFGDDVVKTIISTNIDGSMSNNQGYTATIDWINKTITGFSIYYKSDSTKENKEINKISEGTAQIFYNAENNYYALQVDFVNRKIIALPIIVEGFTANLTFINTRSSAETLSLKNNLRSEIDALNIELNNIKSNANWNNILYKVGDYFITEDNVNPGLRFGGTWKLVTDRFLLGAPGVNYGAIGTEGGSNYLSIDQMPKHSHSLGYRVVGNGHGGGWDNERYLITNSPWTDTYSVGGDQPHIHPYRYVYLWRKTSDNADKNLGNFATPVTTLYRYIETKEDQDSFGTIKLFPTSIPDNELYNEGWIPSVGTIIDDNFARNYPEYMEYANANIGDKLPYSKILVDYYASGAWFVYIYSDGIAECLLPGGGDSGPGYGAGLYGAGTYILPITYDTNTYAIMAPMPSIGDIGAIYINEMTKSSFKLWCDVRDTWGGGIKTIGLIDQSIHPLKYKAWIKVKSKEMSNNMQAYIMPYKTLSAIYAPLLQTAAISPASEKLKGDELWTNNTLNIDSNAVSSKITYTFRWGGDSRGGLEGMSKVITYTFDVDWKQHTVKFITDDVDDLSNYKSDIFIWKAFADNANLEISTGKALKFSSGKITELPLKATNVSNVSIRIENCYVANGL